jgi:hypothetical protein
VPGKALSGRKLAPTQTNRAIYARIFTAANKDSSRSDLIAITASFALHLPIWTHFSRSDGSRRPFHVHRGGGDELQMAIVARKPYTYRPGSLVLCEFRYFMRACAWFLINSCWKKPEMRGSSRSVDWAFACWR